MVATSTYAAPPLSIGSLYFSELKNGSCRGSLQISPGAGAIIRSCDCEHAASLDLQNMGGPGGKTIVSWDPFDHTRTRHCQQRIESLLTLSLYPCLSPSLSGVHLPTTCGAAHWPESGHVTGSVVGA